MTVIHSSAAFLSHFCLRGQLRSTWMQSAEATRPLCKQLNLRRPCREINAAVRLSKSAEYRTLGSAVFNNHSRQLLAIPQATSDRTGIMVLLS